VVVLSRPCASFSFCEYSGPPPLSAVEVAGAAWGVVRGPWFSMVCTLTYRNRTIRSDMSGCWAAVRFSASSPFDLEVFAAVSSDKVLQERLLHSAHMEDAHGMNWNSIDVRFCHAFKRLA
jgi:hypothetical protein